MSGPPSSAAVKASLSTLDEAKQDVQEAESSLETVLADLRVAPRAEKTAVSGAIEGALGRLRQARAKLATAEATLVAGTSDGST